MPDVSIIIPCHQRVGMLRRCLKSLRVDGDSSLTSEVIVLLNGTDPAAAAALTPDDLRNVTLVNSSVNIGFAAGCNLAAQEARGDSLVFLNDDVEVEQGWLAALVGAAAEDPLAGAVGSRVVLPGGLLQEAGSIVWSDGTTLGVGRGLPADGGAYCYRRVVDYCSACALLVTRAAWEALEGFDESFLLGYYEDADLCLRTRDLGLRVLYEPSAVVNHNEHSSSSTPDAVSFLFKVNHDRFLEKWGARLGAYESPGALEPERIERALLRARGWPVRVLVIDDRIPDARIGAGAGRMFLAVRELVASGHAVTVLPLDLNTGDARQLGGMGVEVSREALEDHLSRPEIAYDVVIISRPNNHARALDLVRLHQPQALLVYDAEALYHRRLERQVELATDASAAEQLMREAAAVRASEARIADTVDLVVCISEEEAQWVRGSGASCPVEVVPPFDPLLTAGAPGFAERQGVLFVAGWLGGADSPNGDGLRWFVQDVLPLIEARLPWVQVLVTGANPPEALRWLEGPTVTFLGSVQDLSALHDRVRVVVLPLRYGAGVKLKALDAIARGVPMVGTPVGLEGIPFLDEDIADIADDPTEFARATVALLEDRQLWEHRRASLERLRFRWDASRKHWPEIIDSARRDALVAQPRQAVST
jgi:GT2 family glycosyltransferase/glycosyltransferase involved in cell wall biosynthesis